MDTEADLEAAEEALVVFLVALLAVFLVALLVSSFCRFRVVPVVARFRFFGATSVATGGTVVGTDSLSVASFFVFALAFALGLAFALALVVVLTLALLDAFEALAALGFSFAFPFGFAFVAVVPVAFLVAVSGVVPSGVSADSAAAVGLESPAIVNHESACVSCCVGAGL